MPEKNAPVGEIATQPPPSNGSASLPSSAEARVVGGESKPFTRLSININAETEDVLKRHKENGTSITETVRRAVVLLDLLEKERAGGSRIQLVDSDGAVRELIMFL